MSRFALTVDLRDDPAAIASYIDHHRRVWPEVIASLRGAGIREMDIYILGRRLMMVVETDGRDIRQCFATHMASGPRVAEWEALMQSLLVPPAGSAPGEWWTQMQPVFRLEVAEDSAAAPRR
jgi:L-rhamnose mutarotase